MLVVLLDHVGGQLVVAQRARHGVGQVDVCWFEGVLVAGEPVKERAAFEGDPYREPELRDHPMVGVGEPSRSEVEPHLEAWIGRERDRTEGGDEGGESLLAIDDDECPVGLGRIHTDRADGQVAGWLCALPEQQRSDGEALSDAVEEIRDVALIPHKGPLKPGDA